jgi:hypothetical protein
MLEAWHSRRQGDSCGCRLAGGVGQPCGRRVAAAGRARPARSSTSRRRAAGSCVAGAGASFEAGLLLGASLSQLGQFDAAGRVLNRLAGTELDRTPSAARPGAGLGDVPRPGLADARRVLEEAEASVATRCGGYWHVPTWPGLAGSGVLPGAAIGGPLIA